jgi:hypothetical protein
MDEDGQVEVCLEKVASYRYLGIEVASTMHRTSVLKAAKCLKTARRYQAAIRHFSNRGPDRVDMAVACWANIAVPGITYGLESVVLSDKTLDGLQRIQCQVAKKAMGLHASCNNAAAELLVGFKPVKETIYNMQLCFYARVLGMEEERYAYQAMMEHMEGGWSSPYLAYISRVRVELGAVAMPSTPEAVKLTTRAHFQDLLDGRVNADHSLSAVRRGTKLGRVRSTREGEAWRWVNRVMMGATGLRVRKGKQWKQLCFACPTKRLTEQHVLTECSASAEGRRRTGVSSFMNVCKMKGLGRQESFRRYVLGQDVRGREVDLAEYRQRGKMMGVIIKERMEHKV